MEDNGDWVEQEHMECNGGGVRQQCMEDNGDGVEQEHMEGMGNQVKSYVCNGVPIGRDPIKHKGDGEAKSV